MTAKAKSIAECHIESVVITTCIVDFVIIMQVSKQPLIHSFSFRKEFEGEIVVSHQVRGSICYLPTCTFQGRGEAYDKYLSPPPK